MKRVDRGFRVRTAIREPHVSKGVNGEIVQTTVPEPVVTIRQPLGFQSGRINPDHSRTLLKAVGQRHVVPLDCPVDHAVMQDPSGWLIDGWICLERLDRRRIDVEVDDNVAQISRRPILSDKKFVQKWYIDGCFMNDVQDRNIFVLNPWRLTQDLEPSLSIKYHKVSFGR